MTIRSRVHNEAGRLGITLTTNGADHEIAIPPKPDGRGSSANGGELLLLALAACYCNDVYREADVLGIDVRGVAVEVEGTFGGPGEPARDVAYRVRISAADTTEADVRRLAERTDAVAEVHNTVRVGAAVRLVDVAVGIVG